MLVVVCVYFLMSVNVTDANPISVKRGKMLLTDVNELKKQEINRRRKMRIEQVRQQSKDIANHIRKRVQQKKGNVLKAAEMKENLELQNHQERKLKSLQQKYHQCLDEVGLAHTHAALQPDPVSVLAAQIERISDQAKVRGKQALEKQKAENRIASESENLLKAQKNYLRAAENLRSAKIVAGKLGADDRPERIALMSTAVNAQRELPSNTARHQPTDTGYKKVQETLRITEHRPNNLVQLDGDESDSSISTSCSDEGLLVPCYEFEPTKSSKYSGKIDTVDSAADFGKVLKASYPDLRTTEQSSGRKKLPQFVELPEVLHDGSDGGDEDRKTPDSQEKTSDQYFMSSDPSSTYNPASSLSAYSKRLGRNQQVAPIPMSTETSGPEQDPSKISRSEQKSVLRPMTSGPKSNPSCTSSTEHKSVLRPMISEQLISSVAASHYSLPRTVPVWQSNESKRSVASRPSSRQVHFYDHSSRYQQQCYHPKETVQKIDEPFQKTAVQLAEEVTAASEALQKQEQKKKLHQEQLQQCRSSQALARERLKRQYNLLLSELETLSRKERIARAQNISATAPAIHMSEARLKERGNIRQRNMDSMFERVYYGSSDPNIEDDANTESGLKGKRTDIPHDKQKNVTVESEVKLNVGHCVAPQTSVQRRNPELGKERVSPHIIHSTVVSESNEQQTFRAPVPTKKPEAPPHLLDLTDEVNIHREKTGTVNPKPSGVVHADLESAATVSEALSVSARSSSDTSSRSSSSDVACNKEMSTNTESKILNSKHEIDVLKNKSTKAGEHSNLTRRITSFESSDVVSTRGVSRAESKRETVKMSSKRESQKDGPSKHYELNDGEDSKEQQNSPHTEQLSSNAERLKLLRSKNTKSKKIKDNFDKVEMTAVDSSSSSSCDHSVLESRERCFADPETSTYSTDSHSPCDNVKIVVKVRDKLQELNGNKLYDTVDSQGKNKKAEEGKHCKQHCGKKVLYRDVFTKEPRSQSDASNNLPLDLGQRGRDPTGHQSAAVPKSKAGKPYRDDREQMNKLHIDTGGTTDSEDDEEKQERVSKELDDTMIATSASTSYFSPPEKISSARAKEIDSAVDAVSSFELNTQRSEFAVLDTYTNVNPQLSCYIRRLLAMSRESVENLSVSISDVSVHAEEMSKYSTEQPLYNDEFKSSNSRRAWISILSGRRADKPEILQQTALEVKQGSEQTYGSCAEDVKISNRADSSVVCDSKSNDVHFIATELTDVHSEENKDSNTIELQEIIKDVEDTPVLETEKVNPSDESTVVEINHNDLLVAMNKRIISVINEMNGTDSSLPLESNVLGLERPATNICKQNATDVPSSQTDLSELAEQYSKRVSDLSKKLEHLRLEKQHILEMSSSGSDREVCDTTAYSSPPPKVSIAPDTKQSVIPLHQPENMQLQVASLGTGAVTSHQEHNNIFHSLRRKPPVSLSQKLIRDIGTPHELSTIIEVDSPKVPEFVTRLTEDKVIGSNCQTSIPEVSVTEDKSSSALEEGPSSVEDKNLSDRGGDSVKEIMAELLRRKLLTSPYHWLRDEFEGKVVEHESSVAEALSNECSDREKLDSKTSKENGTNSHSVTDTSEQTSFQTTSKSENSNVEEKCPLAHSTNLHQMDLHNVFEKLGVGWANSMLRKTRQAMMYSSSSSENSHDFSASRRKNSLKDTKLSKEKHQALNYESGNSPLNQDLLPYKTEPFGPATLGSQEVPLQGSSSPENSIKSNTSKTRESEISTAREVSCDDEHLSIKVPNICLTTKLKVSISSSSSIS